MNNTVIKVEGISKRYRIGVEERANTFAQQVKNTMLYPIKNFKRIARMNKFQEEEDASVFWALQEVNFEVKQGDVLGVIGRNGAGKSTLLKVLSKITEPTTGRIEVGGRISSLLEVGTGFHPELSGRDNVYMNGTILGMTRQEIKKNFDEIVAFSGVSQHIDTPVKFYSSGMKVRLGFSVAAHLEPEILIIDEVLAVGDAEFQKRCLGKMDEVSKSGRTVLFVSHNMASVQDLCTRAILLDKGKVAYDGDTGVAISKYIQEQLTKEYCKEFEVSGNPKSSIAKVEIQNKAGRGQGSFNVGEPIVICMEMAVKERLTNPICSARLTNSAGINVTTWRSNDYIVSPFKGKVIGDKMVVKIVIENLHLLNDLYSVSIGFADSNEGLDVKQNIVSFEVQPARVEGTYSLVRSKRSNSILFHKAKWNVE